MAANLKDPLQFQAALRSSLQSLNTLFELAREHELEQIDKDGVTRYLDSTGKTPFQIAGQFDRPSEFLQCLLDILRVNYEPRPLGTMLLNANLCFPLEALDEGPGQLGYLSLLSEPGQSFSSFWSNDVMPRIAQLEYRLEPTTRMYAICSTGEQRYNLDLVENVMDIMNASLDEYLTAMECAEKGAGTNAEPAVLAGYCCDNALGDRIRLSAWLLL